MMPYPVLPWLFLSLALADPATQGNGDPEADTPPRAEADVPAGDDSIQSIGEPSPPAGESPDEPQSQPTEAPPAEPPEPVITAPPTIAEALDAAQQDYFRGEHSNAARSLAALRDRMDAGEPATPQERGETAIYLGEILLLLQDQAGAWEAFRWLLEQDPDYPISAALHPREVVSWFEAARAEVKSQRLEPEPVPVIPSEPRALPLAAYAPFGAPQFQQGRNARGWAYALGQGTAAAASVGMFVHLVQVNREQHPPWLTDEQVAPYVQRWRNRVQWPSTAAFYGLWLVSHLDARITWTHRTPLVVYVSPGPQPSAGVQGRF